MTFTLPDQFVELPPLEHTDQDVRASIEAIQRDLQALAIRGNELETAEPWHFVGGAGEPAFQNGWVNFDATRVARFYKRGERVHLAGVVKSGTIGPAVFTLPSGYRPDPALGNLTFAADSASVFGVVNVLANGDVTVNPGSNAFAFLETVSFRVA